MKISEYSAQNLSRTFSRTFLAQFVRDLAHRVLLIKMVICRNKQHIPCRQKRALAHSRTISSPYIMTK